MQLTQAVILAFSTLAVATPYYHRHSGERSHRPYKTGCHSAPAGAASGFVSGNDSSAAPPYPMGPTASAAFTSAGGAPVQSSSPSETDASSPPIESDAAASSSSVVVASPVAPAPVKSSAPAAPVAPVSGGTTYTATFTEYGAGDTFGSGNCNTATAACGWYSNPGFNAAASQNIFGVGTGAGAGPGCGLCFQLTAKTNPYNNNSPLTGTKSIVIKVNNLCPAEGNPLCSMPNTSTKNSLGGQVNFDLCKDDGAAAALFGSSGVGAALGTATQVSCSQWTGSNNLTS